MDYQKFKQSLTNEQPPDESSELLQAMWYDAQGDWESAHRLAQLDTTRHGALIHGYLHRKEGDLTNANYWYHQAGTNLPTISFEEEWDKIVEKLVKIAHSQIA